eukprot:scaffold113272_cov15-Tisochrysis_lutea.AAC.1
MHQLQCVFCTHTFDNDKAKDDAGVERFDLFYYWGHTEGEVMQMQNDIGVDAILQTEGGANNACITGPASVTPGTLPLARLHPPLLQA